MLRDFYTKKKVSRAPLVAALTVSVVIGLGAGLGMEWISRQASAQWLLGTASGQDGWPTKGQSPPDFVFLAKRLQPAVVNVSAARSVPGKRGALEPPGKNDPLQGFWDEYFGLPTPPGGARERSIGSGFIIEADGLLLTNFHVVDKAEKITVKLSDKRQFEAKVIAKDPKTDLAVLKIVAPGPFPIAPLGDSDRLEVGEWVLAVGNPFGLDNSVTSGIVSAKGRHIGAGPYDSFIQTDASVNPGNSGGPLVNTRGEVVGINMAIVSQSGGNVGIGFATPINQIKELLPELRSKGSVTRGWLGVGVHDLPPEVADSLGLTTARGALVTRVEKSGPADLGGIHVGDVIVEFDGKEIWEAGDLPMLVAKTRVEKQVRIKIFRESKEMALTIKVGRMPESPLSRPYGKSD